MQSFCADEPLIFIHVPKTAGSSVRAVVQNWFPDQFNTHYYNEAQGGLPKRLDLEATSPPPVIYGHFNRLRGFGVDDYYPQVRQFLTILRDPFDMHISRYLFTQKAAVNWKRRSDVEGVSLQEHLETGHLNMLEHFPRPVSFENYRDQIEEFFIDIGCMETLPSCLQRFATKLGRAAPQELPHLNASAPKPELPQKAYAQFRARFPLEFEIYDWVRARSEALAQPQAALPK